VFPLGDDKTQRWVRLNWRLGVVWAEVIGLRERHQLVELEKDSVWDVRCRWCAMCSTRRRGDDHVYTRQMVAVAVERGQVLDE
jgi:hypothetical protein